MGGSRLSGEVSSLGDGRDVSAIVGKNGLENVAGVGEIVRVGDAVDAVLLAAAGGADVQAAVSGGGGDELDRDVDGVGLVAVLGSGVAETNMLPCVVGR
jgi:hypothetical protein